MYVVREIMSCKPGKVRPLVEKFKTMDRIGTKYRMPKMRIMTDFCAEQYWTLVAEFEVADFQEFERMMQMPDMDSEDAKAFQEIMKDYHDLVDHGRREIYKLEN
jgi:hypothetical protein